MGGLILKNILIGNAGLAQEVERWFQTSMMGQSKTYSAPFS